MDTDFIDMVVVHYAKGICVAVTKVLGKYSHFRIAIQKLYWDEKFKIDNLICNCQFLGARPVVYWVLIPRNYSSPIWRTIMVFIQMLLQLQSRSRRRERKNKEWILNVIEWNWQWDIYFMCIFRCIFLCAMAWCWPRQQSLIWISSWNAQNKIWS